MTYRDWRNVGHVSRLSCLTCKGPGQQINTGAGITGSQLGVASTAGSQAASEYNQFQSLIAPLIQKEKALATGDRSAAVEAAQPVLSQLSSGFEAAKQRIMNSIPPGAARDRALADLQTQYTTSIGGAQAGLVNEAPTSLANIGSTVGQFGLQALGAQLNALGGASTTNFNTGKLAAEQEAGLLNFFSSLAGAVASPFSIALGGAKPSTPSPGGIQV